jgi:serine/threonine protein kinase
MAKKPGKKADPLIGAIIDRRWQVIDHLGAGGMGVVYRAERVGLGKQVALKFLNQSVAESKAAVQRFEREAKAISRLHHIHCISILDFGVYRKQPYIVMEFVQGRQLNELSPDSVTPSRAVAMMRQVLLGLQHAHSRGVIHRDLKLSNIMLVEMTGTEDMVKILDFGLARVSGFHEELSLTDGLLAGTPSYMSPEQALGKKTDHRTDIYSAGVMLYVLCTGKRPFIANDTKHLLYLQVNEPPPSPRKLSPAKRISDGLDRVILRALEKKPADRFQNVTEFLQALDDTSEGQETITPTVLRHRPKSRGRLLMFAAAVCIVLGAVGGLWARSYLLKLKAQTQDAYHRLTAAKKQQPVAAPPAPEPKTPPPPPPAPQPEPAKEETKAAELPFPEPAPVAPVEKEKEKPAPPPEAPPVVTAEKPKHEHAAKEAPPPDRDFRQSIEALVADKKFEAAKNQLRDRIAVERSDAWAHLMLGVVYADGYQFHKDSFREWDTALGLDASLKTSAAFRKSLCEAVDTTNSSHAEKFLGDHLAADESVGLLAACIQATEDPTRIENTARVIEAVGGTERPELGRAAMRMLDFGKTCAQKKAAVETIGRLHYVRARGALVKLDRQRLAHKSHPEPALACFGDSIGHAIEQLK